MKPMQLSLSLAVLISVSYCNALFYNFGQSSSETSGSSSSRRSTLKHHSHEQQNEYADQPIGLPSRNDHTSYQSSFGAVDLPLIGTGSDIWTARTGQQDMYRDSERQSQYTPGLYGGYEPPPLPTTPAETHNFGFYHSFEDPMHNLALDSPAFELPPDAPAQHHGSQVWDDQAPSVFNHPHGMPPYHHHHHRTFGGSSSSQASFEASPGGVWEEDMQDMILESSMPHLYQSRTAEDQRDKDHVREEEDDAPVRQSQTLRTRKPRNRNIVVERITPTSTTGTVDMSEKKDEEESHSFLQWLKQQWMERGMNVGMHAQILAQQVAEIKIKNPNFAVYIGRRSSDWVKKAKKGEDEGDEWYLYDYEEWSTTYRKRINNLKAQWEKKYGGMAVLEEGPELQEMLLREYRDTNPSHYGQLADEEREAKEIDRAIRVWEEFEQKKLQRRRTQQEDGEELSIQTIAQESCFFNSSLVSGGHAKTIMYINKYLRNIQRWRPKDLATLKNLQDQLQARFSPMNTRGQQRIRKVQ